MDTFRWVGVSSCGGIFVVAVFVGLVSPSVSAIQGGGTRKESDGPGAMASEDTCALVGKIVRSKIQDLDGSAIVDQRCTKRTAGLSGRIAIDVRVLTHDDSSGRRPLVRGDRCGTSDLVVACDAGDHEGCSEIREYDEHWKLAIWLNVEGPTRVKATAAVLPYKPQCAGCSVVVSPCGPTREAIFEKDAGHWKEVWNRFDKRGKTKSRTDVDAGQAPHPG